MIGEGYGKVSNALVESGAWGLFDPYMRAVYVVLVAVCKRKTTYEDIHGKWSAREGFPSVSRLAELSGVRRSSISATTDALAQIGVIVKAVWRIKDSPRIKYLVLPPEHPMFHSVGERCKRRMCHYRRDRWGLRQHRDGAPAITTTLPTVVTPTVPTVGKGATVPTVGNAPPFTTVGKGSTSSEDRQKIFTEDAGLKSRVTPSSSLSQRTEERKTKSTTKGAPPGPGKLSTLDRHWEKQRNGYFITIAKDITAGQPQKPVEWWIRFYGAKHDPEQIRAAYRAVYGGSGG